MANNKKTFMVDNAPIDATQMHAATLLRTSRNTNAASREAFSDEAMMKLSDVRRAQISDYADGGRRKYGDDPTVVVGIGNGKKKQADVGFGGGGFNTNFRGLGGNVDRMLPELYSPLFQVANLNLPRDRMTMNAWNRNFYDTHPIVRNAINLHSTYPVSKINIKCKYREVEQFFNDMAERIDLFQAIADVTHEFWKIGEAFPFAQLDENNGIWSSIVVQNPDYISVKKSAVANTSVISLRADETLKKVVTSNHPADVKLRTQLPESIIHHVRKNEPIPLDNFNVSHLKMLSSGYDVRGTSMIVSCYKYLQLHDKLFECKLAQADDLVNPITMISVGTGGDGGWRPTEQQLQQYREQLEAATLDKDYKLVTSADVKIERIGASGAVMDTNNDFNFILQMLYAGLMVPKAVMDTEGSTYASASVGLEVLRTRYFIFRNMMEKWLEKKIFAPISQIQGFFEHHDGEKVLIVPEIDWNHINLYDMADYINALGPYVEKGKVSYHTLYRSLGLNWEDEQRRIREEAIRTAILKKEVAELDKMGLNELRSLDPDTQITENTEEKEPLPGEASAEGMPGMEGSMPAELAGAPGAMPPPETASPAPAPEGGAPEAAPPPAAPEAPKT
jgi:hypothetical protein